MTAASGSFRLAIPSLTDPFKYRVVAGAVVSPTYAVTVAHPPRVARIALASGSGFMTMPAPPPYGASSAGWGRSWVYARSGTTR